MSYWSFDLFLEDRVWGTQSLLTIVLTKAVWHFRQMLKSLPGFSGSSLDLTQVQVTLWAAAGVCHRAVKEKGKLQKRSWTSSGTLWGCFSPEINISWNRKPWVLPALKDLQLWICKCQCANALLCAGEVVTHAYARMFTHVHIHTQWPTKSNTEALNLIKCIF
jgi:hypothetical protein